jgi:hypothetical protein
MIFVIFRKKLAQKNSVSIKLLILSPVVTTDKAVYMQYALRMYGMLYIK